MTSGFAETSVEEDPVIVESMPKSEMSVRGSMAPGEREREGIAFTMAFDSKKQFCLRLSTFCNSLLR
jgi:hypothetical protein